MFSNNREDKRDVNIINFLLYNRSSLSPLLLLFLLVYYNMFYAMSGLALLYIHSHSDLKISPASQSQVTGQTLT